MEKATARGRAERERWTLKEASGAEKRGGVKTHTIVRMCKVNEAVDYTKNVRCLGGDRDFSVLVGSSGGLCWLIQIVPVGISFEIESSGLFPKISYS